MQVKIKDHKQGNTIVDASYEFKRAPCRGDYLFLEGNNWIVNAAIWDIDNASVNPNSERSDKMNVPLILEVSACDIGKVDR